MSIANPSAAPWHLIATHQWRLCDPTRATELLIYGPNYWIARVSTLPDALLVRAAPDMLAALEQIVRELECYCADNVAAKGPCAHCLAQAAIKRARTLP